MKLVLMKLPFSCFELWAMVMNDGFGVPSSVDNQFQHYHILYNLLFCFITKYCNKTLMNTLLLLLLSL